MMTRVVRCALVLACAGTLLAGCQSASEPPPQEAPVAKPVETNVSKADTQVERKRTDSAGNPLDMASGQPLGRTFYFDLDRAVISSSDQSVLSAHAAFLRENSDRSIVLSGHCDERGTREYNMALGERRADAVRTYLAAQGVRGNQIRTVSYGEERPVATGHSESAWARNRRVEMDYR